MYPGCFGRRICCVATATAAATTTIQPRDGIIKTLHTCPPKVGEGASLWYGSVVRGDVNHVVIGAGSSVGDSAVVHVAGLAGNKPTIVGSNVVIGERTSTTVW